jgi:succinate dehydrogenase/fumarate reductase cytochrome b subunit
MHIVLTTARALGEASWDRAMGLVTGPLFTFGEYLVFAAFAFHAVNGVRLLLIELGWAVGKPIEPVYPYRTSIDVQRPLAIGAMILAAIVAVLGGVDLVLLK